MNGLILNLGFKGIRAIIFDSKGKKISASHRKVNTYLNKDLVEQNPNEWWYEGLICIKEVLNQQPDIDFITITASSGCLAPTDNKGKSLTRAIMVADKRAKDEAEYIGKLKSFQGLPYRPDPTLMIPKILWIKNNLPEVFEKTSKFLSPNDFFIFQMTNEFVIDELNATKYFTVNNKYPDDLLQEIGIEKNLLPGIKPVGTVLKLSDHFVSEIGLNKKVPLVLTTYDAICALFGVCTNEDGEACDMSGTVTSMRILTDKNLKDNETRIFSQKFNDKNIIGGSNNLGGGLIEWLLHTFYAEDEYHELETLKTHLSAKTGLLFLPYLLGERAPLWDAKIRGAFLGIERFHTKQDLARAVLESAAFVLRHLLEIIEENDIPVSKIYASGGLSKIDLVNQIKADVTGKDVFKVKETEATSVGAYILARKALDKDFDPKEFIEIEKVYKPDESNKEIYAKAYELFKIAYNGLRDFHKKREDSLIASEISKRNL
jgi:xylulokinase